MFAEETVHRYSRWIAWVIELLCALLVVLSLVNLGTTLLRGVWDISGLDRSITRRFPPLDQLVLWIDSSGGRTPFTEWATLAPPLIWFGLALLLALLLRSALPIVRTSSSGMLVEFAGDWLPVHWESIRSIKVTSDVAGKRFVMLVQTDNRHLTGWHRCFSFLYRLGGQRGFLVTSNISQFDQLVQTILSETNRVARLGEGAKAPKLDEQNQSPLFRFLISPASFFSARSKEELAGEPVSGRTTSSRPGSGSRTSGPVEGSYPARIIALINGATLLIVLAAVWHYLNAWFRFLALMIPALRGTPPFSWAFADPAYAEVAAAYRTRAAPFFGIPGSSDLPEPWWIMLAAHLLLLLVIGAAIIIRNLLPALATRAEGLAVRNMLNGRWQLLPWARIAALKATEISDENQVVLIQARGSGAGLPPGRRFSSLLYDGGFAPGILLTSAMSNFQPLLEQVLTQVTAGGNGEATPELQQDSPSWLIWLALRPAAAIAELVDRVRDEVGSKVLNVTALLRVSGPMLQLAALPALFLVAAVGLLRDAPPGLGLLFLVLLILIVALLEWPLVCLISVLLDENTGGGEEGYRAFYIYPRVQLPRLLAMLFALSLLFTGLPGLWVVAWLGAIAWSYVLAAELWNALYQWQGSQSLLGGLIPVVWQLLVMLLFLLIQR